MPGQIILKQLKTSIQIKQIKSSGAALHSIKTITPQHKKVSEVQPQFPIKETPRDVIKVT